MFRNQLGRASGFQSMQYRMLEFVIGNKNAEMIEVYRREPAAYEALQRAVQTPSIYDESLRLLSRRGFEIPDEYLDRDWSQPYQPSKQVAAAWAVRVSQRRCELGLCTSWRKSWSTSTINSSSGASAT